jgi:lambda repressor-like predicted transcriptional regulator
MTAPTLSNVPAATPAAVREAPHHDTTTCYTDYRCRLPECVDRYNTRNRERLRAHKTGTWTALVDATPARRHVRRLQRQGMSGQAIAQAAGVSVHTVLDLLRPHPTKRRARRRRINPSIEVQILAVRGPVSGRIDSTGTIRRVQALVARGWPVSHIARRAGLSCENSSEILQRPRVYVTTAAAINDVYESLRRKRPEKHGVTRAHAAVARNRAARLGWVPPSYWDRQPGAIDDPEFVPEHHKTRLQVMAEEAHWLMTVGGLDRNGAAERLGVDRSYLDRALTTHPEPVLAVVS